MTGDIWPRSLSSTMIRITLKTLSKIKQINGLFLLGILAFGGCALGVKNLKPAQPYDFRLLDQMAKYAQAAYADDVAIRAICLPAFDTVYIQTISASDNKYFLATNHATRTQLIAIAGTANLENALLD